MLLRSGKETQCSEPKLNMCKTNYIIIKNKKFNPMEFERFWTLDIVMYVICYIVLIYYFSNPVFLRHTLLIKKISIKSYNISYQNLENYYLYFTNKSEI